MQTEQTPEIDNTVGSDIGTGGGVVAFNNDTNTFDEVIRVLVKATGCSTAQANNLAIEIDKQGKARVFEGSYSKCIQVSSIIESIGIQTQVEIGWNQSS